MFNLPAGRQEFLVPCSLFIAAKDSNEIRSANIEEILNNSRLSIDLIEYRTRNKECRSISTAKISNKEKQILNVQALPPCSKFLVPCSLFFAAKDSAEIISANIEEILNNSSLSIDMIEYRTRNKEFRSISTASISNKEKQIPNVQALLPCSKFLVPCSLFFAVKDSAEIKRANIEEILNNSRLSIDLIEYRTRNTQRSGYKYLLLILTL